MDKGGERGRQRERERRKSRERERIQSADLNLCIKTVWEKERNIITPNTVITHIHLWQFLCRTKHCFFCFDVKNGEQS